MSEKKETNNKRLLKSGISLSVITFASRIMGLIREMTKASFFGTSMFGDAFTTAFMIPNLLRRLFAEQSISVAFIPTFKKYLEEGNDLENRRKTQEFISATLTLITFCTAVVVVLGIIFSPLLSLPFCKKPLDTGALDYALQLENWNLKHEEITVLTRIMLPYLMLISIAALFQGILNSVGIFAPSGFTPVLFNGIVIAATYILAPHTSNPARAMSIGVVIGGAIQALFQLPFVLKTGWKITFTTLKKTFSNPGTKTVMKLVGPTIIGMAAYQLNDVVSTILANRIGEGIASSLQYSLRLQELILGIFVVSVSTVILPDLSSMANKKDWESFNKMLVQAVKIVTLISIPVTFYSLITGKELISLLYKNKSFDDNSVALTLGAFRWHIAGLLFIALNRIIAPAFYAQRNTKSPTLSGIISFCFNIVFALVFGLLMGGNGIAMALSLASLMNTIFLFIFMKKMESFDVKGLLRNLGLYILKITLFSVIASVPTFFLNRYLTDLFAESSRIIAYGVPVLCTALVFGAAGVILLVVTGDKSTKVILKKIKK